MSTQGVFGFMKPLPPRPTLAERLIFMLLPDPAVSAHVDRFGKQFVYQNDLDGTPLQTGRLHISLHHIGDYKRLRSTIIYAATLAARTVLMTPFEVSLHALMSFAAPPRKRDRPLVLLGEGKGLLELHRALAEALRKNGLRASDQFTPHMTLLYGPRGVPLQPIEPIRFVAKEFALVHSMRGLTKYNVLERWPLQS